MIKILYIFTIGLLTNYSTFGKSVENKFQYEWEQGFKDAIQIENRIKILELEKQKKIKDIEKKLNEHKRNV